MITALLMAFGGFAAASSTTSAGPVLGSILLQEDDEEDSDDSDDTDDFADARRWRRHRCRRRLRTNGLALIAGGFTAIAAGLMLFRRREAPELI